MAIDTLQLSKELQDVEFTPGQADALARIFLDHTNGKLQGNLEGLERRVDTVEQRLDKIEHRLDTVEHRLEMLETSLRDLHEGMKRGFEDLRIALRAEILAGDASTKVDLTKWIVGAIVLNLMGTAGLMITLIRTIPH